MKVSGNRLYYLPLMGRSWRLLQCVKKKLRKQFLEPNVERLYDVVLWENGCSPIMRRALLSYIVYPFLMSPDDPRFWQHMNIWRAQEIVRILNQLGYAVDVIDYRDTSFSPTRSYDLFIGHGGINFEKIAWQLSESAVKIYYSTGCYWKFHNDQELARFAALRDRRGVVLPLDRFIEHSEEGALLAADGIIGLGNEFTRKTYADFSPVFMIKGHVFFDDHYEKLDKDYDEGRRHFLYFAGTGCVHKGLDLLLEAFLELEQHLWICCPIHLEPQFAEVYADALHNRSNIHLVGWIQPRSPKFYELMGICNYVILPSCSEGGAHSVVECMNQGLIPVVSRACGLDVDDFGVILDPCTIEEICSVVQTLSDYPVDRCREMSRKVRITTMTEFSEEAFSRDMRAAILFILQQCGQIDSSSGVKSQGSTPA